MQIQKLSFFFIDVVTTFLEIYNFTLFIWFLDFELSLDIFTQN